MGLCASVVAVGPFSPEIVDCLEYGASAYAGTRVGATMVRELFGIMEGTSSGTEFAACLGISDPWDFNQHRFDPLRIDVERLRALFATLSGGDDYVNDLNRMLKLREFGFMMIFLPNG